MGSLTDPILRDGAKDGRPGVFLRHAQVELAVDGDSGEGKHCEASDGLAEVAGRLKDAEKQQVLYIGASLRVGGAVDDTVVIDAAGTVDIGLNDDWAIGGADLILVRRASGVVEEARSGGHAQRLVLRGSGDGPGEHADQNCDGAEQQHCAGKAC